MKKSHLGFEQEGDWYEIVAFGEKAYVAAKQSIELMDIPEEDREKLRSLAEEFDDWRPKIEEQTRKEVSDKTADNASGEPPETEQIQEKVESAGKNMKESMDAVEENDPKKAGSHWKETTESLVLASGGTLQRILHRVEKSVYKNIMTLLSPYYFDNELFSASLWKKSSGEYTLELVPNNDKFRSVFAEELEVMDDKGRWHVDYEETPDHDKNPDMEESVGNTRSKDMVEKHIEDMKEQNKEIDKQENEENS
jgi:uncharacterized FlaG/YvyC family protein